MRRQAQTKVWAKEDGLKTRRNQKEELSVGTPGKRQPKYRFPNGIPFCSKIREEHKRGFTAHLTKGKRVKDNWV